MMHSKKEALKELKAVIKEFGLKRSNVGLAISGNPSFMDLMEDPDKSITTTTLDKVHKFVLEIRGQLPLPLERT
tara:strand:- start:8680 stop:8901 length:222 start_codon:yes stop_codon:yes gene_type:complete